jgi:hypothetical protein
VTAFASERETKNWRGECVAVPKKATAPGCRPSLRRRCSYAWTAAAFRNFGRTVRRVTAQAVQQVDHTRPRGSHFLHPRGGIIAAATAQWRQSAEHKHDRAMRDLDDLRIVLDHGYDAADGALRSLADAREAIRRHTDSVVTPAPPSFTAQALASWSPEQHERNGKQLEQLTAGIEDVIKPLAERSREHFTEVALFSRRLAIRRGPEDPVTKDLGAVLDALQAMLDAIEASRRC